MTTATDAIKTAVAALPTLLTLILPRNTARPKRVRTSLPTRMATREAGKRPRTASTTATLESINAVALVYLGSVAIVDLTREAETAAEPGQTPQVLLSAYWALLGFASLLFGLLRDDRRFRLAGFALLAIAIAKVFLVDLSTLESIYRVLSFIALGLLLLAAAFAYQRIRARIVEEAP